MRGNTDNLLTHTTSVRKPSPVPRFPLQPKTIHYEKTVSGSGVPANTPPKLTNTKSAPSDIHAKKPADKTVPQKLESTSTAVTVTGNQKSAKNGINTKTVGGAPQLPVKILTPATPSAQAQSQAKVTPVQLNPFNDDDQAPFGFALNVKEVSNSDRNSKMSGPQEVRQPEGATPSMANDDKPADSNADSHAHTSSQIATSIPHRMNSRYGRSMSNLGRSGRKTPDLRRNTSAAKTLKNDPVDRGENEPIYKFNDNDKSDFLDFEEPSGYQRALNESIDNLNRLLVNYQNSNGSEVKIDSFKEENYGLDLRANLHAVEVRNSMNFKDLAIRMPSKKDVTTPEGEGNAQPSTPEFGKTNPEELQVLPVIEDFATSKEAVSPTESNLPSSNKESEGSKILQAPSRYSSSPEKKRHYRHGNSSSLPPLEVQTQPAVNEKKDLKFCKDHMFHLVHYQEKCKLGITGGRYFVAEEELAKLACFVLSDHKGKEPETLETNNLDLLMNNLRGIGCQFVGVFGRPEVGLRGLMGPGTVKDIMAHIQAKGRGIYCHPLTYWPERPMMLLVAVPASERELDEVNKKSEYVLIIRYLTQICNSNVIGLVQRDVDMLRTPTPHMSTNLEPPDVHNSQVRHQKFNWGEGKRLPLNIKQGKNIVDARGGFIYQESSVLAKGGPVLEAYPWQGLALFKTRFRYAKIELAASSLFDLKSLRSFLKLENKDALKALEFEFESSPDKKISNLDPQLVACWDESLWTNSIVLKETLNFLSLDFEFLKRHYLHIPGPLWTRLEEAAACMGRLEFTSLPPLREILEKEDNKQFSEVDEIAAKAVAERLHGNHVTFPAKLAEITAKYKALRTPDLPLKYFRLFYYLQLINEVTADTKKWTFADLVGHIRAIKIATDRNVEIAKIIVSEFVEFYSMLASRVCTTGRLQELVREVITGQKESLDPQAWNRLGCYLREFHSFFATKSTDYRVEICGLQRTAANSRKFILALKVTPSAWALPHLSVYRLKASIQELESLEKDPTFVVTPQPRFCGEIVLPHFAKFGSLINLASGTLGAFFRRNEDLRAEFLCPSKGSNWQVCPEPFSGFELVLDYHPTTRHLVLLHRAHKSLSLHLFSLKENLSFELLKKVDIPENCEISEVKCFRLMPPNNVVLLDQSSRLWHFGFDDSMPKFYSFKIESVDNMMFVPGTDCLLLMGNSRILPFMMSAEEALPAIPVSFAYDPKSAFISQFGNQTQLIYEWRGEIYHRVLKCPIPSLLAESRRLPKLRTNSVFDYLMFVYRKFPVTSAIDGINKKRITQNLSVCAQCQEPLEEVQEMVFEKLKTLESKINKPGSKSLKFLRNTRIFGFDEKCLETAEQSSPIVPLETWLRDLMTMVPFYIARLESQKAPWVKSGADVLEALQLIEPSVQKEMDFGIFESIVSHWSRDVKVISSIGKKSTGKSYFLNHLFGASFNVSNSKFFEGFWVSLKYSPDCLFVLLDLEGLGSFDRNLAEGIPIFLLKTLVSTVTLFMTNSVFDHEDDQLLNLLENTSNFSDETSENIKRQFILLVNEISGLDIDLLTRDFNGKLKNLAGGDGKGNFVTKMYKGGSTIQVMPSFESPEYYEEIRNLEVRIRGEDSATFGSGREFLNFFKMVLAKLAHLKSRH